MPVATFSERFQRVPEERVKECYNKQTGADKDKNVLFFLISNQESD